MSLSPDEQKIRAEGLGASEVATALGENPWEDPVALWALKRKEIAAEDFGDSGPAKWGNLLEPLIATEWAAKRGALLQKASTLRGPAPMLATPDYFIGAMGGDASAISHRPLDMPVWTPIALLEVKAPGLRQASRWGEEETDSIPAEYVIQATCQMGVLRERVPTLDRVYFAILLGGQEEREYVVGWDPELWEELKGQAAEWWQKHVVGGIEPVDDRTDGKRRSEILRKRFPTSGAAMLGWSDAAAEAVATKKAADEVAKNAKEAKDRADAALQALIGPAAGILGPDGKPIATFKNNSNGAPRYQELAEQFCTPEQIAAVTPVPGPRVLRLHIPKEKK